MIIGVISDTHGNRKLTQQAVHRIFDELDAELVIHAGDNYADAEEIGYAGHPIRMVPGLWCDEYHNPRVPNQWVDTFDGLTVAVAHTTKDIKVAPGDVAIAITGHTHVAEVRPEGGTVFLNPGHLKAATDRGQSPSFALIETTEANVRIVIYELKGGVRMERSFARSELA